MRKMRPLAPQNPSDCSLIMHQTPRAVRLDVGSTLGGEHELGHLTDELVAALFVERAMNAGRTLRHGQKDPVGRKLDGLAANVDRPFGKLVPRSPTTALG
jgi:hypothetical protein